jgi:hypothetical protein
VTPAVVGLLTVTALAVAGCGGTEDNAPTESALPRALANKLAAKSEGVAAKLDAGDSCGAAADAASLKETALAAIDAGRVPAAFADELAASVTELVSQIRCQEEQDHGKDKGKGKGKNGNGGKD